MFRQEFPERHVPIVAPDDRTIEMWRVTLGYRLAAPPARCPSTPPVDTTTTATTGVSLACSRSATAAPAAPPPTPHAQSMHLPVYRWPSTVHMAAPTEPAQTFSPTLKAPHPALAAAINVDLASFMSVVSPNAQAQRRER